MIALSTSAPAFAKIFVYELGSATDVAVSAGIELDLRYGAGNELRIEAESENAFEFDNRAGRFELSRGGTWLSPWSQSSGPVAARAVVPSLPKSFEVSSVAVVRLAHCVSSGADLAAVLGSGSRLQMEDFNGAFRRMSMDVLSGFKFSLDARVVLEQADLKVSSGGLLHIGDAAVVKETTVQIYSGTVAELCGANGVVSGAVSSGGRLDIGAQTQAQELELSSGGTARADCWSIKIKAVPLRLPPPLYCCKGKEVISRLQPQQSQPAGTVKTRF